MSTRSVRLTANLLAVSALFTFPNPVNETAARVVAGGVLLAAAVTLATGWYWLLIPIAYGFWARVLTGPTLSPLGWLAQNVIAPRLGRPRPVPVPPSASPRAWAPRSQASRSYSG